MEGGRRERAEHQEEEVLVDDGLLGEPAERGGRRRHVVWGGGLALDARPGEVDVEEEEEDAEADYGGLGGGGGGLVLRWKGGGGEGTNGKLVLVLHQRVVQQVAVDLGLDQDEVDEQHDKVVLDVLVAEAAAVLAHRQADVVAAGLVTAALAP